MNIEAIEWSAAAATMPGETESGDRHVVCNLADGVLVAVLDGLGHGSEAAEAARVAADTLEQYAGRSIIALLERCHDALRSTRGVTMSLAAISTQERVMTWAGVGNVEGVLRRAKPGVADEKLLLRNGVVGSHLPLLHPSVVTLGYGDILIFTTDGVTQDVIQSLPMQGALQSLADTALARGNKRTDDALLLLVRIRGG